MENSVVRTFRNNGCRKCGNFKGESNKVKPAPGKSLGDLHPELLEQLHPTRNEGFDAYQVRPGSGKKARWVCQTCSHEWKATVTIELDMGAKCVDTLQHLKLSTSKPGSLFLRNFPIAGEWHPTKNKEVKPRDVLWGGSKKKYWWK